MPVTCNSPENSLSSPCGQATLLFTLTFRACCFFSSALINQGQSRFTLPWAGFGETDAEIRKLLCLYWVKSKHCLSSSVPCICKMPDPKQKDEALFPGLYLTCTKLSVSLGFCLNQIKQYCPFPEPFLVYSPGWAAGSALSPERVRYVMKSSTTWGAQRRASAVPLLPLCHIQDFGCYPA